MGFKKGFLKAFKEFLQLCEADRQSVIELLERRARLINSFTLEEEMKIIAKINEIDNQLIKIQKGE